VVEKLTEEFLEYAVAQTHPLIKSWYRLADLKENWQEDVKRDAEEFFSDAFAASFARNCKTLELSTERFKHRLLETSTHRFIAGIRFFGMDLNRPFVEVAQINRPLESDSERDEVTALLRREFAAFKPTHWRVYQSSHLEYQFLGCDGDKRYWVGLLKDINAQPDTAQPNTENAERLELQGAKNLDFYPRYAEMYQALYAERPWLPDVSRQESVKDMQEYLDNGWLYEVFVDKVWAGVTAASPGFEVGAKGYYMIEIALDTAFRGQGLGVVLQRNLATVLAEKSSSVTAALLGTIGAVNTPMLKTAARVGRLDIGGHYWIVL
jgi:GNAT superfamily N-acetyltransferase